MKRTPALGKPVLAVVAFICVAGAESPLVESARQVSPASRLFRLEDRTGAMGVTFKVVLYGDDMVRMQEAVRASFEEVRRLDRMLSKYRPDSEVAQLNRSAAEHPVKVTPELLALLSACVRYSRESEGAFDITVGPLMKVWGFYRGTGRLAGRQQVVDALEKTGYRNLLLDEESGTVRFLRPGVELDFGGIGKGYAVDRMANLLKENGISSALVNGGGSSIYGLGSPPSEDQGWEINIEDPRDPSRMVAELYLKNESISTSGTSKKFFQAEGRLYSHIMDPRTGYPAEGVLEVSVTAPRTLDSEAWAKPYFILGRQWAAKHKPRDFRVFLCESRSEEPCAWLQ
jgi:thiamine biosynthesis lipoprotein